MPVNLELLRVYFSQVPDQRLSNLWHELSTEVLEWLGMSLEKLMFIINHQCPVTARYRPMILSGFLYPSPCAGTNSSCSWLSHCRNGSRLSLLNSAWPKVETHAGGQAARRFCKAPWQRCWVTGFRWRLFKVPISFRRPMGRPPLLVYWLFPDGETLQLPMVGQTCRRSFSDPQPGNGQSRAAEGLPCQRKGQTKPWGCILAEKLPHGDPPCIIQSWMTMT